jgi:hypothetical protein
VIYILGDEPTYVIGEWWVESRYDTKKKRINNNHPHN